MAGLRHIDITKRLERHSHVLARTYGHHFLVGQQLRFAITPLENELSHLRQVFARLGVEHLVRTTSP